MTQPQVKTQPRVQVYEGMSVEAVKKNGSDGQKLMAPLFDEDGDGKFNKYEAELFNSCNFKVEKGKITIYNRSGYGTEITELKYDNYEKDILSPDTSGQTTNELGYYHFENDKGEECWFSCLGRYAKVVIDMIKGKVHVEGSNTGSAISLNGANIELTVKNSDLEEINAYGGKIKLQNVKDKGLIWDSATKITTDGKTLVEADADSDIEVSTATEE